MYPKIVKAVWQLIKPLNVSEFVTDKSEVLFHDDKPVAIILNRFPHYSTNHKYSEFIIEALVKHGDTEKLQSEYDAMVNDFNKRYSHLPSQGGAA